MTSANAHFPVSLADKLSLRLRWFYETGFTFRFTNQVQKPHSENGSGLFSINQPTSPLIWFYMCIV